MNQLAPDPKPEKRKKGQDYQETTYDKLTVKGPVIYSDDRKEHKGHQAIEFELKGADDKIYKMALYLNSNNKYKSVQADDFAHSGHNFTPQDEAHLIHKAIIGVVYDNDAAKSALAKMLTKPSEAREEMAGLLDPNIATYIYITAKGDVRTTGKPIGLFKEGNEPVITMGNSLDYALGTPKD